MILSVLAGEVTVAEAARRAKVSETTVTPQITPVDRGSRDVRGDLSAQRVIDPEEYRRVQLVLTHGP